MLWLDNLQLKNLHDMYFLLVDHFHHDILKEAKLLNHQIFHPSDTKNERKTGGGGGVYLVGKVKKKEAFRTKHRYIGISLKDEIPKSRTFALKPTPPIFQD